MTSDFSEQRDSSLTTVLDWLNDAFDGVHSFSWGLVGNRERRSLRASDLLMDTSLQQLILLSAKGSSRPNVADMEIIRLRACLPYMLHEEWYEKDKLHFTAIDDEDESNDATITVDDQENDDESYDEGNGDERTERRSITCNGEVKTSARVRLLRALASMAARSNGLFPEAESFLLEEILPHWDGSDHMGLCLCHDLLPLLTPCSFPELQVKVLRYLEPLFGYGSPRIQHAIISGTLNGLLDRWGRHDWTELFLSKAANSRRSDQELDPNTWKLRTLRELIKWADNLFLKAFLANEGHELVRLSIVDFYETTVSLSMSGPFLASPSPGIVYRLLMAQSALSVDRVCSLLIKFKSVFQRLKEQQRMESGEARNVDR